MGLSLRARLSGRRTLSAARTSTGRVNCPARRTGDKGTEAEGKFEKGVAEVKRVVGGAVDYVTEVVGDGINTVTNAITDMYKSAKKTISKQY